MSSNVRKNHVPIMATVFTGHACGTFKSMLDAFKNLISDIDEGEIKLSEIETSSFNYDFFYRPMWQVPMVNPEPIRLPKYDFRTCHFSDFKLQM